jgi:hypothetical protein
MDNAQIIALAEQLYDDGYDSGTYECCHSRHNSEAAKEKAIKAFASALAAAKAEPAEAGCAACGTGER